MNSYFYFFYFLICIATLHIQPIRQPTNQYPLRLNKYDNIISYFKSLPDIN